MNYFKFGLNFCAIMIIATLCLFSYTYYGFVAGMSVMIICCGVIAYFYCKQKCDMENCQKTINSLKKNLTECGLQHMRLYFDTSPLGVIEWSDDLIVRSCNRKAQEIFEYDESEFIGLHLHAIVPEKFHDRIALLQRRIADGKTISDHQEEFRNVTKSGKVIYCKWFITPIHDAQGRITGFYSHAFDITERWLAEKTLRSYKDRFDNIMQAIDVIVYVMEPDGRISYANPPAYQLFGVTGDRQDNVMFTELFHDEQQKDIAAKRVEHLLRGGSLRPQRYVLKKQDDTHETIPVEVRAVSFLENGVRKVLGVAHPIADQLALEEERLRNQKMASIRYLAGGIAHDFNNIIGVIMGFASLGEKRNNIAEKDHAFEQILIGAERAADLVKQLSDYSRHDGSATVEKKAASLSQPINESVRFVMGKNTQSTYTISIADDLWLANFHYGQICQMMQNLIINAVQAMPRGGAVHVDVNNVTLCDNDVNHLPQGHYVHIRVKDSGIGIPEEYVSSIFDPYFSTKATNGDGRGLGLAVAHSIVQGHQGSIIVRSKVGKGTSFHIYLPAIFHHMDDLNAQVCDAKEHKRSCRILVVDDIEANRHLMKMMVESIGHICETAEGGAEAVDCYRDNWENGTPFDLVITDLTMPGGMSGVDLAHALTHIDPDVTVVAMSGYSEEFSTIFRGFIQKPFSIGQLSEFIDRI